MPSLVAIDIETTGLDFQSDAIIEVAAVRFNGRRVEAEWSSLINPGRPIPPMITQLTGITNEMVRNAPPMRAILTELADFVGDAPVVGHNVGFDLSFLQRYNILKLNEVVDTYELAAVLLPTSSRYNLGTLGQQLGILIPNSHRALDDARLAHAVFTRLYDKTLALPLELLAEFVRLSEPLDWGAGWLFQQVLRARIREPLPPRRAGSTDYSALFHEKDELLGPPLTPAATPTPLNPDEAAAILEHGGVFSHYFKSFEYRPQQVEMTRAVSQALSEGYHLMVEAGTGTGKSFAYLVPAALFAYQNNTRVVISTNTITLQDQLIQKDIPDLCAALDIDLRATVLKGRSNYLCPRRLEVLRQRGPESAEEMRVLAKILVWLNEGGQGDRNEINLNGPVERDIWSRISAEDEGCKAEVCMSRTGGACPFYMARQAAQSAHLLVVNHALLLSDVITGSRVLPDYNYLIVDEGHHIESATTSALSFRVSQGDLQRLLREMGGSASGSLGRLLTITRNMLRPSDFAALNQAVQRLTDLAFRLENNLNQLFQAIDLFLESMREGQPVSNYGQQVRIQGATRTLPAWSEVEMAWDSTGETYKLLLNLLNQILQSFSELDVQSQELEDNIGVLGTLARRLGEANAYLGGMISDPDAGSIYWIEVPPTNHRIVLQVAPLHVGPLMEKYLWHEKTCVILTSATLTTNSEFEYLRNRLNADEADELVLGSPFDYEGAALLYLANDIPEPSDASAYQRAVEQSLVHLATSTGGRLLALFTSYAQLKRTSQAIGPALAEKDIQLYEQGEGASTNTLLETFRESERAVLLGTRAFWEGVDIPGEALSVLVIVKLPFDVPSDPIIAARSETFEDPFSEYSLPEAILRFRQGFGRLIRTQSDRGVVAILDRRILTKRYGKLFIESLPQCKVQIGSLHDLPKSAARWLNL
ncbi:exonuclease, DNA polymerase III, epsilon subunit family [Longilinea arvoryzae]|uniref:3'-5' exonuclease DinG n=1 Tax=Longilinea arvoryzae TaxID=360412 RepID=A0A0S7BJZ1_9CHLR|nr:helicase C-terminal domain-containing protein [Longilinea arvoryzae]GAP14117.1 exonuclease, DNA polymerase III, epsilon subunit family [Longilinea arvoryzae]